VNTPSIGTNADDELISSILCHLKLGHPKPVEHYLSPDMVPEESQRIVAVYLATTLGFIIGTFAARMTSVSADQFPAFSNQLDALLKGFGV